MDPAWVRLRFDLRSRCRAWLSVALLSGLFGGGVVGTMSARAAARTQPALALRTV